LADLLATGVEKMGEINGVSGVTEVCTEGVAEQEQLDGGVQDDKTFL
jgi:hypothetical protein